MTSLKEQVDECIDIDDFAILNAERCNHEELNKIFGDEYTIEWEIAKYMLTRSFNLKHLDDINSQVNEHSSIKCSKGIVEYDDYSPTCEEFFFDKSSMKKIKSDGDIYDASVTFMKEVDVYIISSLDNE